MIKTIVIVRHRRVQNPEFQGKSIDFLEQNQIQVLTSTISFASKQAGSCRSDREDQSHDETQMRLDPGRNIRFLCNSNHTAGSLSR